MGYRQGDETVAFEGKIEMKTKATYIVETTLFGKYFVPLSQIATMSDPADEDGNREFVVAEWWWNKREDYVAT